MPTILKFITVHALACFMFLLAVVVPGIPFSVNGEVLTSEEIWESGYGVSVFFVGTVMPLLGILLLIRTKNCRGLYVFAIACVLILPYLYWQQYLLALIGLAFSVAMALYLFKNKRVLAYFGS